MTGPELSKHQWSETIGAGAAPPSRRARATHRHRLGHDQLPATGIGSGPKLAVGMRVGLGLLAVRDIARASGSPAAPPPTAPTVAFSWEANYRRGGHSHAPGGVRSNGGVHDSGGAPTRQGGEVCHGMLAASRVRGGFSALPLSRSRGVLPEGLGCSSPPVRGTPSRRRTCGSSWAGTGDGPCPPGARVMPLQSSQQGQHVRDAGHQAAAQSSQQHQQHPQGIPQAAATTTRSASSAVLRPGGSPNSSAATAAAAGEGSGEAPSGPGHVMGAPGKDGARGESRLGVISRASGGGGGSNRQAHSAATATLKAKVKVTLVPFLGA